jgi:hypothetical protein
MVRPKPIGMIRVRIPAVNPKRFPVVGPTLGSLTARG